MSTLLIAAIAGILVIVVALFTFGRRGGGQDMNTITSRPVTPSPVTAPPLGTQIMASEATTADQFERLARLHTEGSLTEAEFTDAKARVLAGEAPSGSRQVVLTAGGDNKIAAIKALREVRQDMGLKEAKDAVEGTPFLVANGVTPDQAEAIAGFLRHAGASVEIR
ncbi:MAG: ribosomal protein L7/L12 [Caulobacteraceae bacterium]